MAPAVQPDREPPRTQRYAALVARLEALLSERMDLVQRLGTLAPGDGAGAPLERRLHHLTAEQERLLQELASVLPPSDANAA